MSYPACRFPMTELPRYQGKPCSLQIQANLVYVQGITTCLPSMAAPES
jgi:hypothetical protein